MGLAVDVHEGMHAVWRDCTAIFAPARKRWRQRRSLK
jgi:hypothetical protein